MKLTDALSLQEGLDPAIVNDIVDKNFDKKVERTKNRPIASKKVSIKIALIYIVVLCGLAFLVLINFNNFTIFLALIIFKN